MSVDATQGPSGPRPEDATDEELARTARAGSSFAFAHLVRRYDARIFRFVRRWGLSAADAEDVTQEAFIAAWQGLDRFDHRREFRPWLFAIASRRASTHARAAARRAARDPSWSAPVRNEADPEPTTDVWALARRLLNEEACSALWLRYVEEMSAAQVARVLGRTTVGVRVMLHRARALLAERYIAADRELESAPRDHASPRSSAGLRSDRLVECAP